MLRFVVRRGYYALPHVPAEADVVGMPTRNLLGTLVCRFPPKLFRGHEWCVTTQASILPSLFKEMKMSKPTVRGTLYTLVLFAAVAVFSNMADLRLLDTGKMNVGPSSNNDSGILTADGGAPYPRPPVSEPTAS